MFKNYLFIAARSFLKHKGYALINAIGLVAGIFCSLVIFLYANYELGYDEFHKNHDGIYRVAVSYKTNSGIDINTAMSPSALAPQLREHVHGVHNAVRFQRYQGAVIIDDGKKKDVYNETTILKTDPNLLNVFTHSMIYGDPQTALSKPNSVVLSEKLALRYFGTTDAIGKVVNVEYENYTVTGVIENPPINSDLYGEGFINYEFFETWNDFEVYTYVHLQDGASIGQMTQGIDDLMTRNCAALELYNMNSSLRSTLQQLAKVHFIGGYADDTPKGNLTYTYILLAIGVLIIVLVIINYANLSILKSMDRTKEVGVRKSLGALRGQLILQFFAEAAALTLICFLISVILLGLLLPLINRFFDISLPLASLFEMRIVFAVVAMIIVVGLVSAIYPALFTSSVNISAGIKGRHSLPGTTQIRQSLLVLQFGIAAIAIACTFIIRSQMNFLWSQPLGFDKEQTIVLDVPGLSDRDLYALRDQMINSPIKLASVVGADAYPGGESTPWQLVWTFYKGNKIELAVNTFYVDEYFQDVLRIPLVAGRLFQPLVNKADYVNAIIVNERFVQRMGWTTEEAIGQRITVFDNHWDIIGVAKDFHYQSLGSKIEPLFMALVNKQWPPEKKLLVKVAGKRDIEYVHAKWKSIAQAPFDFSFLDEDFSRYYRNEQALTRMAAYFSGISLLLAAVGLIGLASLLTAQRTREIGIRKVMGATQAGIFSLLFKDFIVFACIGYVISIPLTWVVMRSWLSEFPLRIPLGVLSFVLPGVVIFSVTLITTSFQILRGASANPVDSLRHE